MTRGRPVRIAHAYGNRRDRLAQALSADVDMIEADVWFTGGEVHIRHEHRLGRLPLLVDRRSRSMPVIGPWALPLPRDYFLRPELSPFRLGRLLDTVDGRKSVLIDVKGNQTTNAAAFAAEIVRHVQERGAARWTAVCGHWRVMDAIREAAIGVDVRYTIESPARLERYLQRLFAGRASPAVCAYHALLDQPAMRVLQERGVDVYAWTVDDEQRASALLELGVSGVTSNDLDLLARLGNDAGSSRA